MRQTIGGTWLLQLVILFILLFVGYIVLTLNYSRTIKVKNEIVSIVEKYEGLNETSIGLVNSYLISTNYGVTGPCTDTQQSGVYGSLDLNTAELEEARPGVKYYYCIKKYNGINTSKYYQVTLFYKFNLPVVGETGKFTIKGTTTNFQSVDDKKYCYTLDGTCAIYTNKPSNSGSNSNNKPSNSGGNTTKRTYTVSFDLNGGTAQKEHGDGNVFKKISPETVREGEKATKPSKPFKYSPSSTFLGWELNGQLYDFNTPVTSDITLTAKWEEKVEVWFISNCGYTEYKVETNETKTWSATGGIIHHYSKGDTITNPVILKEGPMFGDNDWNNVYNWIYTFNNVAYWKDSSGKAYDFSTPLNSDMKLTAVCSK